MTYRIREVNTDEDDVVDTLRELHRLTFFDEALLPDFEHGHWWLAHTWGAWGSRVEPVGFAGLIPSTYYPGAGYLNRVGVLPAHRGNGLQKKFIRVCEARARRNGWHQIVTDTTDNPPSANAFIGTGYKMFAPEFPWSLSRAVYWRKEMR